MNNVESKAKAPSNRKSANRSALDRFSTSSNKKVQSYGRGSDAENYTNGSVYVTDNFNKFIEESNGAKRYKVHKPGCSCDKIVSLYPKIKTDERNDGKFQSFVVVPDVKRIKSVFEYTAVSVESYNSDPLGCEKDLRNVIFPNSKSTQPDMVDNHDIKVSCANCMLAIEPNGFLCCASSKKIVDHARDSARRKMDDLQSAGVALHADHADFICCLNIRNLESLVKTTRRRGKVVGSLELLQELRNENVPVDDYTKESERLFSVGSHLKRALEILKRRKNRKDSHILVIITKSKRNGWLSLELDLPGGKRHLGERSFECAIRETKEEASLSIDKLWLVGDGMPMFDLKSIENMNAFFMVEPPGLDKKEKVVSINSARKENADQTLAQIEKDIFWSNTGLRD